MNNIVRLHNTMVDGKVISPAIFLLRDLGLKTSDFVLLAMLRAERYRHFVEYFSAHQPDAETELHYGNAFQLLIAVILSAQCTDKRINQVTPAIFRDFPTPESLAAATPEQVFEYIRSVSYPNNK